LISRAIVLLFLAHNFLPYFGLRFESCQTMFSNFLISADGRSNNHYLFPQTRGSDLGTYLKLRDLKIYWRTAPSLRYQTQEAFLRKASWVNVEALRWILRGMCIQAELISAEVSQDFQTYQSIKNLCLDKFFSFPRLFIPIQLYPPSDGYELKIKEQMGGYR
ncbi:MAG: hypothetical protein EBQ92_01295, partial [Proteobacteria bacterium]|nr:hypothetical protein [Pseudomonadota bacterium]